MALALLPVHRIEEALAVLKTKAAASPHAKELKPFVSYFNKEWMNTFEPSTWSVCDKTWRTNNYAEGKMICGTLRLYFT